MPVYSTGTGGPWKGEKPNDRRPKPKPTPKK